jgi:hypothetical protein
MVTLKQVKYVRENLTCYVVGEVFRQALSLARDIELANELGLEVKWAVETEDWMEFAGDPSELYKEKFEAGEWTVYHAYVEDGSGGYLAGLSGIILASEDGKIGYEHELLSEAVHALKKGDGCE